MDERVLKSLILPIDDGQGNVDDVKYTIPQGTVTEDMLSKSEGTKADAIVRSASGEIASYDDGGDLPMKSLKVNIVPKQSGSGDPSPDNVRPISGTDEVEIVRTGANLWDEVTESGSINLSNGANVADSSKIRAKNFIPVLPNTTYYKKTPSGFWNVYYDASKNFISYADPNQGTFTTPANCYYMRFNLEPAYGTTYKDDVSINYPSTDTEYHKGATPEEKSITLPQTVYGGTLDVVRGKLVIDMVGKVLNGSTPLAGYAMERGFFAFNVSDFKSPVNTEKAQIVADKLKTVPRNQQTAGNTYQISGGDANSYGMGLQLSPTENTVALATAWLTSNPVQIYYKTETPTEIDLTPTEVKSLLGDNNVWSDSGTVEVEYRADTSIVINKILEALA